jgi:hypothetical protein
MTTGPSFAGCIERRNRGMTMPVAQAARLRRPVPIDRWAPRGIPGERFLPWPQPASRAKMFGRFRFAMNEAAGPSPVLPKSVSVNPVVTNPEVATAFRTTMPQRKSERCDLLHKRAGRLPLNFGNDREILPIIVRCESRHRHRLRLDGRRRRRDPDRADLSHLDLNQR